MTDDTAAAEISMEQGSAREARSGRRGRAERAAAADAASHVAGAKPQPLRPYLPTPAVSEDELQSIHEASLTILQEIGMDFLHDEAKAILKAAGADVDPNSDRVRFDKALIESKIGLAPKTFTLHARNSARNVQIGGNAVAVFFMEGSSCGILGVMSFFSAWPAFLRADVLGRGRLKKYPRPSRRWHPRTTLCPT